MSELTIPKENRKLTNYDEIRSFLKDRGIRFERWDLQNITGEFDQEKILKAYADDVERIKKEGGYRTADVIAVDGGIPNLSDVRNKFLPEHTHSEDEVRFFVEGSGLFWFHPEKDGTEEVFCVLCEAGDLISVPANTKHWFDMGEKVLVKAIRFFTDQAGWVPHYTNSGLDKEYNPVYN